MGKTKLSDDEIRARLAQTRPPASAVRGSGTVTGARSTATAKAVTGSGQPFANAKVGLPTPKDERDPNPAPYARIEDVKKGTVLRSHTVTGEAHPVDLENPDGQLRQDQVPEDVFQASCTPLGTATILPVQPDMAAAEPEPEPVSEGEVPEESTASSEAASEASPAGE